MAKAKAISLAAAIALCCAAIPARADSLNVNTNGGYARLLFALTPQAHATASVTAGVLTIAFDRKIAADPTTLAQTLPALVGSARVDADGKTYHFALAQPARVHSSASGEKIAIDLLPESFTGTPPDLPQPPVRGPVAVDPSKLDPLKVRSGAYQHFTRIVFDWPKTVPYAVYPGSGKLTMRFEALARPDFSALVKQAPPWVKNAAWHVEGKGIVVAFETDQASGYHDFRDGARIVLDVLAPKTDADAYAPPGTAKIKPTLLAAAAPKHDAVSKAQAQEIAAASAKLSGATAVASAPIVPQPATKTPPSTTTAAASSTAAPTATADSAAPTPPPAQTGPSSADGRVTRDGAVMTFAGASRKGSAVFIRGLTAWIALQDAPPVDAARIKAELGTFPDAVDVSTSNGVSVLRITLKRPEEIGAFADGSNLRVVIAPTVAPNAMAIGFARNQDDATHASLSALLPAATRAVDLVDPVAGDELVLVPGAAGHALLSERSYVEFQALKTASGLVLAPFADDLSVKVETARVTITRPGGLSLTPPAAPVANSPAALTGTGTASFIPFAAWSRTQGGSFLSAERRLRAATSRLAPENANRARLTLARFYLANKFAAEALGLIRLMQATDPGLQSDRQLLTMRAAANYMMERYRDASNDIAGAAFDSDPHAALWRGLTEAALGDWNRAQADLDRAEQVLNLYPREWQARARLAAAEAGLERNHPELADAALMRLPENVPPELALQAQLERARLHAMEGQGDAAELFASVENSGDARESAQAVYYRVSAALTNGSIQTPMAINELEKLRFRWRGDALEMKTLRKLSALYFSRKQWRDGLRTLRIATESFPNDDLARNAQDDMRSAFVNLFLKGQADKIAPIEALSLFYDNLDLTPIGPEGDEMIRRMSDRLVAVDLLGPAADLLKYQIDKRLDGVARAQVATTLAGIYLMDRKPDLAVSEIRATEVSTLPDDVRHQRMLIEARALAEMKHYEDALDMIAVDQSADAARLRADVYWQSGNWTVAGQEAEQALGARWDDAAVLSADERQQVMRAAIAYSLANDETSLNRLRDHFAPKMRTTPDAASFKAVSGRIDAHGAAFRDAAAQIASIDTLKTFMKDMHAQSAAVRMN